MPRSRVRKSMPTDAGVMANTLADVSARQIGNNELYWALFKSQPWIRSCIRLIANSVAQEGFDIQPVDDAATISESDPRPGQINAWLRVCFIGRFNTFRKFAKAVTTDMETYGAGYARKKRGQSDGVGTVVFLERLDARYMVPHLAADKKSIDYFVLAPTRVEAADAIQQAASLLQAQSGIAGEEIPAEDVIMFSTDDGGDAVLPSPSPLEALDLSAAMDMSVRKHRNAFFQNGATLGNVLACEQGTDDQVRDAQKKLNLQHSGSQRAYKNIAIAGKWQLLNLMQAGRHEIDFVKGTEITIQEIMAVYNIPPGKLRDISGAMGQAAKDSDNETFDEECVLPIEECFYETLTLEILHKEFDIDDLRLVPSRRNKLRLDRIDAAVKLVKCGGTGNQALDLIGLPKSDDPGMDIPLFIGATGQAGVASDEAVDPSNPPTPPGSQQGDIPVDEAEDEVGATAKGKGWY